jgi:NAD(P)-dependent dehydrogenase (short-subunit alcohol dehydrogenase family)
MDFKNKVTIITGASQGFGLALAKAISLQGSRVIISSENKDRLKAAANGLNVDCFRADVTSPKELHELTEYVLGKYGQIDIWINNAGIQIAPSNVEDVDIQKLRRLFDVNFFGYFYGCQAILPILKQQGYGAIVNINSTAGLSGKPGISAYVASKFAIKGLTQSIREEVKDSNIQIYGIHPGGMQTEIYKEKYPADFKEYMSVDYAIKKIMDNFKAAQPELDLLVPRP